MYTPDFWCVIKINSKDPHYRVFASWSGGYVNGTSWRMNSGITDVEEEGDYYLFYGSSGSVYKCHKNAYGCHYASQGTLNHYMSQPEVAVVDLLPEETDWLSMEWIIKMAVKESRGGVLAPADIPVIKEALVQYVQRNELNREDEAKVMHLLHRLNRIA